jgi:DNA replication licensing factor MCM2
MTVRHIESMIRMAEAHAKMHLREYVTDDDLNMGIRVMLNSFISTQKYSVARELKKKFGIYLTYKKDSNDALLAILQSLVRQVNANPQPGDVVQIRAQTLEARARMMEITDVRPFYNSPQFKSNGFTKEGKTLIKTFGFQ